MFYKSKTMCCIVLFATCLGVDTAWGGIIVTQVNSATATLNAPGTSTVVRSGTVTFNSDHSIVISRDDYPAYQGAVGGTYTFMNGKDATVAAQYTGYVVWNSGQGPSPKSFTRALPGTLSIMVTTPTSYTAFAKTKWLQDNGDDNIPTIVSQSYHPFSVIP